MIGQVSDRTISETNMSTSLLVIRKVRNLMERGKERCEGDV